MLSILLKQLKEKYRKYKCYLVYWRWLRQNHDKPVTIYAKSQSPGLKVHLGAGPINIQGWINVDARAYEHTHLVATDFELEQFADGAISEIYMCHVLEHFSFVEAEMLLKNLRRKLREGGMVRISVPCFDKLVAVYSDNQFDLEIIKYALMGGQDYEYNFHKSVYNKKNLERLFEMCGYSGVTEWNTIEDFGVDLGDWSSRSFAPPKEMRQISLNLKASN